MLPSTSGLTFYVLSASFASSKVTLQYFVMRTKLVPTPKRQAIELLSDLERRKEPVPANYDALQQRLRLLEGIACGERAVEEGRTLSQVQARQRMAGWLK